MMIPLMGSVQASLFHVLGPFSHMLSWVNKKQGMSSWYLLHGWYFAPWNGQSVVVHHVRGATHRSANKPPPSPRARSATLWPTATDAYSVASRGRWISKAARKDHKSRRTRYPNLAIMFGGRNSKKNQSFRILSGWNRGQTVHQTQTIHCCPNAPRRDSLHFSTS